MRALLLVALMALGSALAPDVACGDLPIYCTFDPDPVGAPPGVGGANQPAELVTPPHGSLLVRAAANGIDTQPCEIRVPVSGEYGSISFSFSPIAAEVLRVETTVSMNRRATAYLMQTSASNGAVATALSVGPDGSILGDWSGTVVGSYQADSPFRIRMDIDMNAKTFAATVDEEMNGFSDDQVFEGLTFREDPANVPDISWLRASLESNQNGLISVAYDDVVLTTTPAPVAPATWGELKRHLTQNR